MFFFRKKLKKSAKEDEVAFGKMIEEEKIGFLDGLAMILSAFFVIVLPCLLLLVGLSALAMLILGVL
ncbi:MAG: hypothetical protein IKK94_00890 [Clostridia bacterium]|nr:hypothetical protein [Clostridia bacterium]MBR6602550.1 hypothetical protein [Clostridia bacterium]